MLKRLIEEIDSIMERDPAASSRLEVFLLYSGFKAVQSYRVANWFYRHDMKLIARIFPNVPAIKPGLKSIREPRLAKGCSSTMAWE